MVNSKTKEAFKHFLDGRMKTEEEIMFELTLSRGRGVFKGKNTDWEKRPPRYKNGSY